MRTVSVMMPLSLPFSMRTTLVTAGSGIVSATTTTTTTGTRSGRMSVRA